jgi:hypothetical protein
VSRGELLGGTYRLDVATGGDPEGIFIQAIRALPVRDGEVWDVSTRHDHDCPSLVVGSMRSCDCEIVELRAWRAA